MARRVHQMTRHVLVHPQRRLPLVHIEPEMLEHPLLILLGSTVSPLLDYKSVT